MYRNRKYRSGTSTLLRGNASSSLSSQQKNDAATTVATATSDQSNSISRILTEQVNIIPEEEEGDGSPMSKILKINPSRPIRKRRPPSPAIIPASQNMPVSCYVSQRSILQRTQSYLSGSCSQRGPLSYFERVLQKCGMILNETPADNCYTLNCDHLKFVIGLRAELCANPQYPENIQQFLSGLQDLLKSQGQLMKLLTGCAIRLPDAEASRPSQESLMQDLLMIDFLQANILEILLNQIKCIAVDDHGPTLHIELILSQLKFVDHFTNGDHLFNKIMEILRLAENNVQQTIIRYLQDIIDTKRHNDVVQALVALIPSDSVLLTETTIDTFGNMNINVECYAKICDKIVHYIKSNAPMQLWPTFMKFILNFKNPSTEDLIKIIDNLRLCLKWESPLQRDGSQTEVFKCISRSLIRSKQLFDVWLKVIQSNCERFKPIDFLIMLMMMTINDEKSVYIENIIRRKIKMEIIQPSLLDEMVQHFPSILMVYSSIFFELMDFFLRDKNQMLINFASNAFKRVFSIETCDQKILLNKLVGFVCEKRAPSVSHDSSHPSTDITTNVLMILMDINTKYPVEMQKNSLQILRILDHIGDLTLTQFRIVMDILCSLAYQEPQCELLKNHIDMLVKKQVSSSIRAVKNRGIIGIVRVIDHIVWEKRDNRMEVDSGSDLDTSFQTIEDLPSVVPRTAATFVDMLITSTLSCPYHLALAFDELSSVFVSRNKRYRHDANVRLNKHFLIWICDLMSSYFEGNFLVDIEKITIAVPRLTLKALYGLNAPPESNGSGDIEPARIAIDVAGGVLTNASSSLSSIIILPSLFNLLRILQFHRYSGSLEAINAILGTSLVLPAAMALEHDGDIFDNFNEDVCKQILDMHFHTVNFWRECISAYVSQQDADMRQMVLTRLSVVIQLEQTIQDLLKMAPDDYVPPVCQFMSPTNNMRRNLMKFKKPTGPAKKAAARKKVSPKAQNMTSAPGVDTQATGPSASGGILTGNLTGLGKAAERKSIDFCETSELYRVMDPDIMLLFDENLILKYPMTQNTIGTALGLLEFKFLIEDVTKKVERLIGIGKSVDQQDIAYPHDFISDLLQMLPKVLQFFKQLSDHLKSIIDGESEDIENISQVFTDETNLIKMCFGLCMRLLSALYTWTGFEANEHQNLLCESLKAIIGADHQFATDPTIEDIALVGIECIVSYADVVLDLRSAVYMFKLVRSLVKHVNDDGAYKKYVVDLCYGFLTHPWYDQNGCEEYGALCNILLDELLIGYFKDAKLSFVRDHVTWINAELNTFVKNDKKATFKTFPCFKKNNFSVLFRVLYSSMISMLERKIDKNARKIGQLKLWENSHKLVAMFLDIVKSLDMPRNFSLFLKYTQTYLKLFLLHGIPIIESILKDKVERVSELLLNLQTTTRFLHILCVHSKEIKNTAIVAQIPTVRETVEQLVFKVKGALAANKCSAVFWMGNLKNKNLEGNEIASQASSITRNSIEEDDDGVRGDDDDCDMLSIVQMCGDDAADEHNTAGPSTSRGRRSKCGPNFSRSRELTM